MNADGLSTSDDYTIKRVPFGLLSSSVLTPDLPFRATQHTIGYYLVEKKNITENSYGVHKSEYSGTGEAKCILGEHEYIAARRTNHLRTGLHDIPQPLMSKEALSRRVIKNKSFFGEPINKVACDISQLSHSAISKPLPKPVHKQLFPRSVVFEIEYVKEQYHKAMMEALEKERKEFEEQIKKQRKLEVEHSQEAYNNINLNETEFSPNEKQDEMKKEETLIEKKVTDIIPKENILRDEKQQKSEETCKSICSLCGCTLIRGHCHTCIIKNKSQELESAFKKEESCPELKTQDPKYGLSWGSMRQVEMMRVHYPYKTDIARWHYCSVPPFNASEYSSSSKKFLEKSLTSINI